MKQLILNFSDEDMAYLDLVARRKDIDWKDYIINNLEWDDIPECISDGKMPDIEICEYCDWNDRCPDAVGE